MTGYLSETSSEQQNNLPYILANISDAAIVLSEKLYVNYINPAAEKFFQWHSAQILNLPCRQLISNSKNSCRFLQKFPDYLTKQSKNENYAPIIEEGIEWQINILPETSEQAKTYLIIAKAKSLSMLFNNSDFIYNIRHDTQTPLSCIIGLAKILLAQETAAEKKQWLDAIVESGESLTELLNDILDIRNISESNIQYRNVPCNIRELAQKIMSMLSGTAKQKNLAFTASYDSKLPKLVLGDRHRLQRVLLNLLNNALKFTLKGSVNLSITAEKNAAEPKKVILKIVVADTGMGIPADKQEQIFKKFVRLDNVKNTIPGSGLGLAIVKQFVTEMDGEISVTSKEKKGTQFICKIPFETVDESLVEMVAQSQTEKEAITAQAITATNQQTIKPAKTLHFLLVEDHNLAQIIARKIITRLHCTVDSARNAEEAISHLKQKKYDVILMDIGLPDKNGIALTEEIRSQLNIDTPIVMLTAHILEENQAQIFAAGATLLHQKPLTETLLDSLIKRFSKS